MQITIELPEDIAVRLESTWKDLPRVALIHQRPSHFGFGSQVPWPLGRRPDEHSGLSDLGL